MMFEPSTSNKKAVMYLDNTKICEIRFRVPHWMKEDFRSYCESKDIPAAHLLRQYIRRVLRQNMEGSDT